MCVCAFISVSQQPIEGKDLSTYCFTWRQADVNSHVANVGVNLLQASYRSLVDWCGSAVGSKPSGFILF